MASISYETIIWTVRYFIFSAVMLTVLFIVSASLISSTNVQDVESHVFINRVIYSENINHVDETGRIHAGVIDINKLGPGNLKKEFVYDEKNALAAKLTLYQNNERRGGIVYYNMDWYIIWEPRVGTPGKGGVSFVQRNVSVLIKDDKGLNNGVLEFKVIIPNT